MNPNSFDHLPTQRTPLPCLFKALIALFLLVLLLVLTPWLLIMHSPLPLHLVTKLIEEGSTHSNLKITGTSGSLASGLNFKKVRWNDGEITDLRIRYSGIIDLIHRKKLIIHEMHIGSANLNHPFPNTSEKKTASPGTNPTTKPKSSEPLLRLIRIDRVLLNQITIKNSPTEHPIVLPKIKWTGFKAEAGQPTQLGELIASSNHLNLKTRNSPNPLYQKNIELTLLPKLHPRILQPIHISALVAETDHKLHFDIKALDGTLQLTSRPDHSLLVRATNANLANFINAPLPTKLHLDAKMNEAALTIRSGSFLLGTKSFEIQATTVTETDDKPPGTILLALHRSDSLEIRYEIPLQEHTDSEQAAIPALSSTPAMAPDELLALLFHDREFHSLPPNDQEKLRRHLPWFTFQR